MSDASIKGLADLQKALDTLPAKIEANILRSALRAGAKVILEEAKSRVPVKTGLLRDGLKVRTGLKKGKATATISTGGKHGFIAKFMEFGVATHEIKAKDGGSLFFGSVFASKVVHPGLRPRPFMRPALDSKASEAVVAFGNQVKRRLTKQGIETPDIEVDA